MAQGVDSGPVPFSEFQTLDAGDRIKGHNSFVRLTCVREQDDPRLIVSDLESDALFETPRYRLSVRRGNFGSGVLKTSDTRHFASDEEAVGFARIAMLSPNLARWDLVSVSEDLPGSMRVEPFHRDRLLGSWIRGVELIWRPDYAPTLDFGAMIAEESRP